MDFGVLQNGKQEKAGGALQGATTMDLETAKKAIKDLLGPKFSEMMKQARALEVHDAASVGVSMEMRTSIKKVKKLVKAEMDALIAEPDEFVKGVRAFARTIAGPLDEIDKELAGKQKRYTAEQERQRREAEQKRKAEQEALQKKLDKQAEEGGYEAPTVPDLVEPEASTMARTESGAALHVRKTWKAEVTDEGAVPREYCTVDTRKINAAVKAGVREIPGVRIFEDITPIQRG
jgi:hypothetical protein